MIATGVAVASPNRSFTVMAGLVPAMVGRVPGISSTAPRRMAGTDPRITSWITSGDGQDGPQDRAAHEPPRPRTISSTARSDSRTIAVSLW
jgi:hypothetical protein